MSCRRPLLTAAAALAAALAALACVPSAAVAQQQSLARVAPTPTRVIVKFRETTSARGESRTASIASEAETASAAAEVLAETVRRVAARARLELRNERPLALGMHVLELDSRNPAEPFDARLARLRADPEIEFAEPDEWRFPLALPNDLHYGDQWYWHDRVDAPSSVNAEAAWDVTTGSPGVVIAVLDTGVLFDHPDLGRAGAGGRLLPGYDFITNPLIANDGNGRDADPSDPGDWVEVADLIRVEFPECEPGDSSWHGTRVTGLVGARTDNTEGIAAGAWSTWILPVRVLGKCGGFDSDIIDAMLWAGGVPLLDAPPNPHPAKVLNLSLGSTASGCPFSYQNVVENLVDRGVLVVVSSGNDGGPVSAPGNCPGVLAVTGLRQAGTKVGFSNVGPEVGIGAPGGNCVNIAPGSPCLFTIDTTYNVGVEGPGTHTYTGHAANYGTSFASPIVSAVAGLMLSVNGNLGAEALRTRLRESAEPFPPAPGVVVCHVPVNEDDLQTAECACTTSTCGAGMVDAPAAVEAALRPIAAIAAPSSVSPGQTITLSAAGSGAACNHSITQYAWSASGLSGVTSPSTAETGVLVPVIGSVVVELTVTDDAGRQDTAQLTLTSTSAVTTAPADAGDNACPAEISPIGVLVEPRTASVLVDNELDFNAIIVGPVTDTSVTWQVNGIAGGNATVGFVSDTGLYTAPAAVPSPAQVAVTAVANADTRATGSAQVTITVPPPAQPPPPPPSSGGGGGGGAGLDLLALLALLAPAAGSPLRRCRRESR